VQGKSASVSKKQDGALINGGKLKSISKQKASFCVLKSLEKTNCMS
jgi:hypothetical protein